MTMKGYSSFPDAPGLEPRHQVVLCHIKETSWDEFFLFHYRSAIDVFTLFTNPSARAGYDTRSIFKRSLTGLNSEFSFS